jgi:hypothetical protein
VNILSTARPPRPDVLAVVPSFHWSRTSAADRLESVRSVRLRVEVAAPWYETGEGESLAVVIAATDQATPVTRAGRDPVVASPPVPSAPAAGWFPGATAAEVPAEGVTVVPYAVERHEDRWFADIAVALPSYSPFVRLALARYQPDSLPRVAVSPVTLADPVPLPPDRRLVVDRDGGSVRITLTGIMPVPANRVDVVLEEALGPAGDLTALAPDPALPVAAWRPVSAATGAPVTLTLPPGTAPLRLRIREVQPFDAPPAGDTPAELRERTVFLEVLALPRDWRPA